MLASAIAARARVGQAAEAPVPAVASLIDGSDAVLGVTLNGRMLGGDTTLAVRGGKAMVPIDDLKTWRLRCDQVATLDIDGRRFVSLSSIRGLTFRVDADRQLLALTAEADAFEASSLSETPRYLSPTESARTLHVSYDLSIERAAGRLHAAAFIETGGSDERGRIANTMTIGNSLNGRGAVRLDTYAIRDDPAGLTQLQIGDGLSRGASWAPNVRFGGIRFGTEFALQPGFLSFPTPTFGGRASLPSSVELYVNDVLNYQSKVREGPFTLNRLPVVAGAGRATLVMRDALGVEQRVVTRYYVNPELLRRGIADYSFELGAQRQRYGQASFDYGRAFAAGSYRSGITSALTIESHAEVAHDVVGIGAGATTILGSFAEVSGAIAVSETPNGTGYLYRVSAARRAADWTFALAYQSISTHYAQIGLAERSDRPRTIFQASAGTTIRSLGSVTAGATYLRRADGFASTISSITFGRNIHQKLYLNLFGLHSEANRGVASVTTIGMGLSVPLGGRRNAYFQADTRQARAELQQTVLDSTGWGYRLVAGEGSIGQQQADLSYRGRAIDVSGQVSRFAGKTAERMLASGAFVLADGAIFPTRRLDGAFAIVDTGGQRGIEVLQDNRPVTRTNGRGLAIVTRMRPYEPNRVALSPDSLALDATLGTDTLIVVPRTSAAARARFEVRSGRAGTLVVTLPDGEALDPGTRLVIEGTDRQLLAGFGGEVFIDNLVEGTTLIATARDGRCRVRVPAVPKDLLPRIGPLDCTPVTP